MQVAKLTELDLRLALEAVRSEAICFVCTRTQGAKWLRIYIYMYIHIGLPLRGRAPNTA